MKLYQLFVPIPNYNNDGIFFQEMFIMSTYQPSPNDWINLAVENHNRDSQYPEYTGDWQHVLDIFQQASTLNKWPSMASNVVSTNTFVTTKFGEQPFTITRPYVKML